MIPAAAGGKMMAMTISRTSDDWTMLPDHCLGSYARNVLVWSKAKKKM